MKNPLKKKFAQFLKEKRAAKGLTYKEFSLLIYGEENKKNYYLFDSTKNNNDLEKKIFNLVLKKLKQ